MGLDRWLDAVGPENESYFWDYLKIHADSGVALIRQVGTAVNAAGDTAVNAAVSERRTRGPQSRRRGNGPLRAGQHRANGVLEVAMGGEERRRSLVADRRVA